MSWWLVRAACVVDERFFSQFFWKLEGPVHIHVTHVNLCTATACSNYHAGWC